MNLRHRTRRSLALAGLVFVFAILPATAIGHAALVTVTPADGSTVPGSPTRIVMTFAQNLDPAKSSIRVADAGGAVVIEGGTVPAGQPREIDLAIPTALVPGTYMIRWTTFSTEDGEQARGTTTFVVAAVATPSSTPPAAPGTTTAALSAVPSIASSVAPTPSSSPTTPGSSTGDALVPIVAALVVLAGFGLWLLRRRSPSGR